MRLEYQTPCQSRVFKHSSTRKTSRRRIRPSVDTQSRLRLCQQAHQGVFFRWRNQLPQLLCRLENDPVSHLSIRLPALVQAPHSQEKAFRHLPTSGQASSNLLSMMPIPSMVSHCYLLQPCLTVFDLCFLTITSM